MEWPNLMSSWLALLFATCLLLVLGSKGCFQQERTALLGIKYDFINQYDDQNPAMEVGFNRLLWNSNDPNSDCCGWDYVTCDSASGHVTQLSPDFLLDSGEYNLNFSLFLPLKKLSMLNLAHNYFLTWTPSEDNISTFALETIDLSLNDFDSSIMKPLSRFKSLKNLILSYNMMNVSFENQVFNHLAGLSNLEVVILSGNGFTGRIPQGLCAMKNLRKLDLSNNWLEGPLPTCLSNLSTLQLLDLSKNNLTGQVSLPLITSLMSLEYLSLSQNQFEGLFPLSILANHSKLKLFSIGVQHRNFQVDTENPTWVPSFQLEHLYMQSCKLNMPTASFPSFLFHQHDMKGIDISGNKLIGTFPNWLFFNNSNLESVILSDNLLSGELELHRHSNRTKVLQISNNAIEGRLPDIGFFFPSLEQLIASSNRFVGGIPASFGNMSALQTLDLSNNNISGEIPQFMTNSEYLTLRLSHNSISGPIMRRPLNATVFLFVDNNKFNGTPHELGLQHLTNGLDILDISNNQLVGNLSSYIDNLYEFNLLSMSGNNFMGAIPQKLCSIVVAYLDLSHNRLSGSIPSCLLNGPLRYLHLQENSLVGSIPEMSTNELLITLDLRGNKLSGSIPDSIASLKNIKALLLGGNNLQGQLSDGLCQLQQLRLLDLSKNKLSGILPSWFSNMSFMKAQVQFEDQFVSSWGPIIERVDVRTKTTLLSYQGEILNYMSLIDLSSNQFTGEIPWQMGDLHALLSLNLSHNLLNGSIPQSLGNMIVLESLDLSFNNLGGSIPPELQELHFLGFFNVSYNNLSGRNLDKGQFATFDENSYKGNPYLSWSIDNKGIANNSIPPPTLSEDNDTQEDESAIDATTFVYSFAASYVTILLVLVTVLWINPGWRVAWFYFTDTCLYYCFYRFLKCKF